MNNINFSLGLNFPSLPVPDFHPQETRKLINFNMCGLGNLTCNNSYDELDAEETISWTKGSLGLESWMSG